MESTLRPCTSSLTDRVTQMKPSNSANMSARTPIPSALPSATIVTRVFMVPVTRNESIGMENSRPSAETASFIGSASRSAPRLLIFEGRMLAGSQVTARPQTSTVQPSTFTGRHGRGTRPLRPVVSAVRTAYLRSGTLPTFTTRGGSTVIAPLRSSRSRATRPSSPSTATWTASRSMAESVAALAKWNGRLEPGCTVSVSLNDLMAPMMVR
jgi:hypothetical protein